MKYLRNFESIGIEKLKISLVDKGVTFGDWKLYWFYPDSLSWFNGYAEILMTPFYDNREGITPTMLLDEVEFLEDEIKIDYPKTEKEIKEFEELYFKYSYDAIRDFETRLENEELLKLFTDMKIDIEIKRILPRIILKTIEIKDKYTVLNTIMKNTPYVDFHPYGLCSNNFKNKEMKDLIKKLNDKFPWIIESNKFNV